VARHLGELQRAGRGDDDRDSISCTAPSSPVTETLPWPSTRPVPWKVSILFFFIRKTRPLVFCSTVLSLWAISFFRFTFGFAISMPSASKECSASSSISVACSSAFEGMQPTLTQVPP
jgi:hypothetical protein